MKNINWRSQLWNTEAAYSRGLAEGRAFLPVKEKEVEMLRQSVHIAWPGISPEEAVEACIHSRRQRLDAVPDLAQYPELDGCLEATQAHDKGFAESAALTPGELAVVREYIWLTRRHSQSKKWFPEHGCTAVFIADSPDGPLAGFNLDDWPAHAPIGLPRGPLISSRGLGALAVSCSVFCDDDSPEIFPVPIDHIVSNTCNDVDDALELMTRYNYFWGPHNRLYFDSKGKSAIIEKSACRMGIRVGNGYSCTTAIHMETPAMKPFLRERRDQYLESSGLGFDSVDQAYWAAAEARHHNLERLTCEAAKNPSADALAGVLQSRDGAASLCLHGDRCHRDEELLNWTLSTTVWKVAQNCATVWRMKKEGGAPSCENEPEHVCFDASEK